MHSAADSAERCPNGKAAVTWRESHAAVGCLVTAVLTIFLRSWARMIITESPSKPRSDRSHENKHAADIASANSKTPDFLAHSEFFVATGSDAMSAQQVQGARFDPRHHC